MPEASSVSTEAPAAARVPAISPAESAQARGHELQEYSQLRERYLRTANALASAAHDLKTPLAILNGYVEVLQSEKLGGLNERQREVLRDMRSNGQRLQRYIQDFLSFSVLETGELRMRFEAGNINACLSEVCRLWSPRFQERGLALYFLANDKVQEFPFDAPKIKGQTSFLKPRRPQAADFGKTGIDIACLKSHSEFPGLEHTETQKILDIPLEPLAIGTHVAQHFALAFI